MVSGSASICRDIDRDVSVSVPYWDKTGVTGTALRSHDVRGGPGNNPEPVRFYLGDDILDMQPSPWYETEESIEADCNHGAWVQRILPKVIRAIGSELTPRQQTCICSVYLIGLSQRETARRIYSNQSNVRRNLLAGISRLREYFGVAA